MFDEVCVVVPASVNVTMVTPGADDEMVITDLAYGAIRADIARPGDAVARRR
ncbi:MAG: hypothetical protein LAO77_17505 [Acidobacteriia bacterium]|nr:hypothetical protein [Terriglobia bacterium]